jgi:hypothetical protein
MVNVTYTPASSDLVYYQDDGTEVIYNLGDMAWSELLDPMIRNHHRDRQADCWPRLHEVDGMDSADLASQS